MFFLSNTELSRSAIKGIRMIAKLGSRKKPFSAARQPTKDIKKGLLRPEFVLLLTKKKSTATSTLVNAGML